MNPPGDFISTKIMTTLGPATCRDDVIARLIEEGATMMRLNFSHGTFEDHEAVLAAVRQAAGQTGMPVAIMGDLRGPKIRLGDVKSADSTTIELVAGDHILFQKADIIGPGEDFQQDSHDHPAVFSTTCPPLLDQIAVGQRVLINDGLVRLLAIECNGQGDARQVLCRVTVGGPVSKAKGINVPDTALSLSSITSYDHKCIEWAVKNNLDYLALSFVRHSDEIRQLKTILSQQVAENMGQDEVGPQVIAKIEKPQALDDIEAIIGESAGIMVARGDLGVEMDLAEVPSIQKRLVSMAHDYGKPVIVATQMLQSMIERPTPTRAEVSDVANAIYDGADTVMLSGETAIGKYPVQVVHTMSRVAQMTELDLMDSKHTDTHDQLRQAPKKLQESRYRTAALAHGVSTIVEDLGAKLIATWSQRGGGARYLSQNRIGIPIIAASNDPASVRRMNLYHGVQPIELEKPDDVESFVTMIDQWILRQAWAKAGQSILIIAGEPIGTPGVTNSIRLHCLGETGHGR